MAGCTGAHGTVEWRTTIVIVTTMMTVRRVAMTVMTPALVVLMVSAVSFVAHDEVDIYNNGWV